MSVCGQPEEESASEEVGAPRLEPYEQKGASKVVRVLTVLAYLLSVSLAAILLSVYYVCVWQSPKLPLINGTGDGEVAARRAADPHYNETTTPYHNHGGSSGSINENDTLSQPPVNITIETPNISSTSTEPSFLDTTGSTSLADNVTDYIGADNSSVT